MNNFITENLDSWKSITSFNSIIKIHENHYDGHEFIYIESPTSVTEETPAFKYLSYFDNHAYIDKFKSNFPEIATEIDDSSYILTLTENWDNDGALKIPTSTYIAATQLLKQYALYILDNHKIKISSPSISPVKDGTVDLEWHTSNARFLINFKNDKVASYYGDNNNNLNSIKGKISVSQVEDFLAAWMIKLKL